MLQGKADSGEIRGGAGALFEGLMAKYDECSEKLEAISPEEMQAATCGEFVDAGVREGWLRIDIE